MQQRVLVVEDDASIREVVKLGLERAGFEVEAAADGRLGLEAFEARRPDAVVLDLMLPEVDGLELCRRMRVGSGVPIVILSARDDTTDVIVGLEMGADDYLTKPFQPSELVARVRAVLRRAASFESGDVLAVGGLEIDLGAYRVRGPDGELALTATEFRLLCELARRRNQVFTRQLLLELVWGYDHLGDSRMVDAAVQRLRGKLEGCGVGITAVRGVGYRLEAP